MEQMEFSQDHLQIMMEMQEKLQQRLGYDFKSLDPVGRTALIKEFSIHISQEINEMLYELPFFKPWKDYSNMKPSEIYAGYEKGKKEFIDFFHFMLNVALLLELTSKDLFEAYIEKNLENYKRQEEGYTHDVSYR